MEYGFGLATIAGLLAVVSSLALCECGCFAGLVLCYFVLGMFLALTAGTVGPMGFRDVDHGACGEEDPRC